MSRAKPNSGSFRKTPSTNPYEGCLGLVYARVSSKRQETEGSGLQSQEGRCISDLKTISVPYEKSFLDSYSGGGDFMNRPAMRELLEYIDKRPHKKYVVIFDDLKRFARDVEFHIKLRTAFRIRGVPLRCLNYTFDESPEGKFAELIMAGQAELEREQNKRQVVQKQRARLELGYWPFGHRKGYNITKDPLHGKLCIPNEQGLSILKPAMEGFANGTLQRKIDVCRFLVEKGFWKKPQKPDKYIDKITDWLKDPFYAGDIEYPIWEVTRRKGHHEPLISLETYDLIQKRLKKESLNKRIRIDNSPDFSLRGLVYCVDCKSHLTGSWVKGRSKKYPYYLCHTKGCKAYGKGIPRENVEGEFNKLLQRNRLKDDVDPILFTMFERVWADEVSKIAANESILEQQKKTLEGKVSDLTTLMLNARSDVLKRTYEKQIEDTAQELESLESESIGKTDLRIPYRTALNKATTLLKNPYLIWQKLDVFEKQKLFYFVFEEKLPYSRTEHYRTAEKSYSIRLFEEFAYQNTPLVEMAGVKPASKT